MGTNPTALFLDLAARARHLSGRDAAGPPGHGPPRLVRGR